MNLDIGLMPVLHALLGSVRVLVVLLVGPIFSHPALSARVRITMALMVAWAVGPVGVDAMAGTQWDVLSVAGAVIVEVMVGRMIGVGLGLVFAGILQLGEFMAVQGGLGAARSIDPTSGSSSVAIGTALNAFAMIIFLAINGHHELIRGIALSFTAIPIGGGLPDTSIFLEVARMGSVIYEVALRIAAPVTVAIFIQNIATGMLGRAMPQLNLLLVNLPLHVGMLLLIVGLGASDFVHAFKDVLEAWPDEVFGIVLGVR